MERESTIEFLDGYLEITMKGEFSLEEYAKVMSEVAEMKDLPKELKVLGIDKGIILNIDPEEVILLSKFREKAVGIYTNVRHAYVVKEPKNTALTFLTSSSTKSKHYKAEIFSSKKAAIDWLFS